VSSSLTLATNGSGTYEPSLNLNNRLCGTFAKAQLAPACAPPISAPAFSITLGG
jgi:hypothetical protein